MQKAASGIEKEEEESRGRRRGGDEEEEERRRKKGSCAPDLKEAGEEKGQTESQQTELTV